MGLVVLSLATPTAGHAEEKTAHAVAQRVSVVLTPGQSMVQLASLAQDGNAAVRSAARKVEDRTRGADAREIDCLARGIYFEARGESAEGRMAVGSVILNRVGHASYPDTVCKVVYQNAERRGRCQFSFACDGIPDAITERATWQAIRELAERLLTENGPLRAPVLLASTHYHTRSVAPGWASRLVVTGRIGDHVFYRDKTS